MNFEKIKFVLFFIGALGFGILISLIILLDKEQLTQTLMLIGLVSIFVISSTSIANALIIKKK